LLQRRVEESRGEINNYLLPTLELACSSREGYQGEEGDQEEEHSSKVRGGGSGAGGELVVSR
jgi:hypothetical protein